ncbi:hypothetical protein [Mycolicibacterium sediminis]|uniref:Lipoprotein n=1 Tax=Mycolicibacterium sediminis TaxID=1286180 RepID=A0A7I7QIN4_9MYCO|nr:hypothetical protein [Mycolicibacterium sediminis]BBY26124.1 hypothetical protein MSEDJ_02200 [Mycolicibacterium sediminis]
MIQRVLIALTAVAVLVACDPLGRPSLESAFGARVLDGNLHIWTGSTCHDVIGLGLTFDPNKQDTRAELMMTAPNRVGVDVDYFALGEPVRGLTVTQPLPPGFDWRRAEDVRINVDGITKGGWGDTTDLAEVIENSAAHPDDTYWFQGVGWLDPEEVARQDGKTFLATCTDSPE